MEIWTEAAAAIRTARSLESRGQVRSGGGGRGAGLAGRRRWRGGGAVGRCEGGMNAVNAGRAGRAGWLAA